jgi:hypothetical protein
MLPLVASPSRRLVALSAALLLATASVAFAANPPPPPPPAPPIDTTAIGFIERVRIGTAPCDTCPPRVCPDRPFPVTISGRLRSPCEHFRGFRELPVAAPFTVLAADFMLDTCGVACPTVMVPFSATVMMSPVAPGEHSFMLSHTVRSCPDSLTAVTQSRFYTYRAERTCEDPPPPPPSLDSLVRTLTTFHVVPERRCGGDSLRLQMAKRGCPSCVELVSLEHDPAAGVRAQVEWRTPCVELVCLPETLSVELGAFQAGSFDLNVHVDVRVLSPPAPDTVIAYVRPVRFEVARCDTGEARCVLPWLAAEHNRRGCAVEVEPGAVAPLTLHAITHVPLGGLQGRLDCPAPFRIAGVRPPAGARGVHVSWVSEDRNARYVVFTSDGATLPAGFTPVLTVDVGADAGTPLGSRAPLIPLIQVASGPAGEDVPLCAIRALKLAPVQLCVASPADSCDANGDGRADVRDLVVMARCLRLEGTGPQATPNCVLDCTGDGAMTFEDVVCCARHILRGPFLPRDSVGRDDSVIVHLEPLRASVDGWRVRVRVSGAAGLGGAMLRLRYPGDRWRADVPVSVDARTGAANEGWFPMLDTGQPGVIQFGALRLADAASGELEALFALSPNGSPEAGDRLVVEGADLVGSDGAARSPSAPLPEFALHGPGTPPDPPAGIELGPARPNPFARSTSFSVSLPRETDVQLTVHDLAGRRVATLASGRQPAGRRDFTWVGAGVRDGVYFVRLTVEGRVYSSRVALLRDGR